MNMKTISPMVRYGALPALGALLFAGAAGASPSCEAPVQVLVIEPLNALGPVTDVPSAPATEAVLRHGRKVFELAVAAVSYDSGGARAHGVETLGSVVGSLQWRIALPSPVGGGTARGATGCVAVSDLVSGPPMSVNVNGPGAELSLTHVRSAVLRIPANAATAGAAGASAIVGVTSRESSDCSGPALADSYYSPATKFVSGTPELGCQASRFGPSQVLFVQDVAGLPFE
jgi:hypothetical protein